MIKKNIINVLENIFSSKILTSQNDKNPYLTDWRKKYSGRALAVVFPNHINEIKKFVLLAKKNNLAVVPQGGNTGLCGGATPNKKFNNIVISFKYFNKIRNIDTKSNSITLESGCILENVQREVEKVSKIFPIDLSSKGSCMIGGNLGTNAGGNNVIKYGSTRDLVLGIEAVLPNGDIINNLSKPYKDNTEYPFHKLLVGSEGTLGLITAATIKLFDKPKLKITIIVEFENIEKALETLQFFKSNIENNIEAFEIMTKEILNIIYKHFPSFKKPFGKVPKLIGIIDVITNSDFDMNHYIENKTIFESRVFSIIEKAIDKNLMNDAIIAQSIKQQNEIWEVRENANIAQTLEGDVTRNDISVPLNKITEFWNETTKALLNSYNKISICAFGHLGDGNIHFNLISKVKNDMVFIKKNNQLKNIVLNNVKKFGGSFSAEHGIGQLKKKELIKFKDKNTLKLMKKIKYIFDPKNFFNPGKIF